METTNNAIEEQLHFFSSLVRELHVLICCYTTDYRIIYQNQKFSEYFGDDGQLTGREFISLFKPEQLQEMLDVYKQIQDQAIQQSFTNQVVTISGKICTIRWTSKLMYDSNNQIIGFQTVGEDITDFVQAVINLSENERRYQLLAENITDVVWTMDLNMKYIYLSSSIESFQGYTVEEFKNIPFEQTLTPESYQKTMQVLKGGIDEIMSGNPDVYKKVWSLELQYVKKNGEIFWGETDVKLIEADLPHRIVMQGITRNIHKRKLAEISMRESEEKLIQLSETIDDIFTFRDKEGNIIYMNEGAFQRFFNIPVTDFSRNSQKLKEFVHPDDMPNVQKFLLDINKNPDQNISFEYRICLPNQPVRFLYTRLFCIYNAQNEVYRHISVTSDITAIKTAELAARESEEKYRMITENTSDVIWTMDYNLRLTYISPSVQHFVGYTIDEIFKLPHNQLVEPEYYHHIVSAFQVILKAINDGTTQIFKENFVLESIFIHKSGKQLWGETTLRILTNENTREYSFIATTRDVNKRKLAEIQARETEHRFKIVTNSNPNAILLVNNKGQMTLTNRAAQQLFQYSEEEMLMQPLSLILRNESAHFHQHRLERYIEQQVGRCAHITERAEFNFRRKNNSTFIGELTITEEMNCNTYYMVATIQDVTNNRQTQMKLAESEELFRSLVKNLPELIIVHVDFCIQYINNYCEEILGYLPEEVLGNDIFDFIPQKYHTKIRNSVSQRHLNQNVESYEFEILHKNGVLKNVLLRGSMIKYQNKDAILAVLTDITMRKQQEQELMESEERFRKVIQQSTDGFTMINAEGKIIEWNNKMENLVHLKTEDAINQYIWDIQYKLKAKKESYEGYVIWAKKQFAELLVDSTKTWQSTTSIMTNPKIKKALEIHTYLIQVKSERIVCVNLRDVTDNRQLFDKLQLSEKKYRLLVDTLQEGVWMIDHENYTTFVNDYITNLLGYRVTEMQGRNILNFIENQHRKSFLRIIEQSRQNKKVNHHFIFNHKSGSFISTIIKTTPLFDESGNYTGTLAAITDNSKRKQIMRELHDREQRFAQLAENINEVFVLRDSDLKIIYINPMFEKVFGKRVDDYINSNKTILDLVCPAEEAKTVEFIEQLTKPAFTQIVELKTRICTKDTNYRWIWIRAFPILNAKGKMYRIAEIISDITSQKDEELQLIHLKEEAERAYNFKSEFLANMSHEIRTPINVIVGFADILKTKLKASKEYSEYLESIMLAGKNLLALINDILNLSRLESGRLELSQEQIDIRKFLEEIHRIFSLKLQEKNLDFTIRFINEAPERIITDETRLRQIIYNLIGNAIKFTPSGSVTVLVETEKLDNNLCNISIGIADTGIGIGKEQLERIFLPFMQALNQRVSQYGGSGLGLAISKRLAEAMNGKINVESEIDKGTTFTLTIPNVEISTDIAKMNNNKSQNLLFNSDLVLVVEDEYPNTQIILAYLANLNLQLATATNGEEAIQKVKANMPSLILMDLQMPIMNGYEAAKIIKSDPNFQHIPIIAHTAFHEERENKAINKYFDKFIFKPFTRNELISVLSEFLTHTVSSGDEILEIPTLRNSNITRDTRKSLYKDELQIYFQDEHDFPEEFVNRVCNVYMPHYEIVSKTLTFEEILDFGEDIIKLSKQFGVKSFERYATVLIEKTKHFDVKSLIDLLPIFKQMAEAMISK